MPEPQELKVGDKVMFIAMPDEWTTPSCEIPEESILFMERMNKRKFPSRVYEIDEYGQPWICAIFKENGERRYHTWAIMESTGWRKVKKR